jgi:hypothetical protein
MGAIGHRKVKGEEVLRYKVAAKRRNRVVWEGLEEAGG